MVGEVALQTSEVPSKSLSSSPDTCIRIHADLLLGYWMHPYVILLCSFPGGSGNLSNPFVLFPFKLEILFLDGACKPFFLQFRGNAGAV